MDPISFLIGALVLTACAKVGIAATADAVSTLRASKAGEWDLIDRDRERRATARERWAAAWADRRRQRHEAAGGDGEFRPGARAYAADLYHGFWEDRLERRAAKRTGRGPYVYDPDALTLGQRFDAAVMAKVVRAREKWGQYRAEPEPVEDTPLDDLLVYDEPAPRPVAYAPGTWTVDDRGERVDLAPPEPDDTGNEDDDEHLGAVDAIHGTRNEGDAMPTLIASDLATEINTNEDARRSFAIIESLTQHAQDALAALEAVVEKLKAAANATTDGMSAKRFDSLAQQAALEAAEAVNLGDVGEWYGKFESAQAAAKVGADSLNKYLDAEDVVAANNIDTTTLAATSS